MYASPLSRNRPPRYSTDKAHGLLPAKEGAEQLKDTLNRSDKISQLILSSSMNQTIRNRNNMKQAAKKSLISSVAFSQQQRLPLHEDCARRVSLPNLRAADSSLQQNPSQTSSSAITPIADHHHIKNEASSNNLRIRGDLPQHMCKQSMEYRVGQPGKLQVQSAVDYAEASDRESLRNNINRHARKHPTDSDKKILDAVSVQQRRYASQLQREAKEKRALDILKHSLE